MVDALLCREPAANPARPDFTIWPPDVFAVVAYLLDETGTYVTLVEENSYWPPPIPKLSDPTASEWGDEARRVGVKWIGSGDSPDRLKPPAEVVTTWRDTMASYWDMTVEDARSLTTEPCKKFAQNLARLLAYADEACSGFGIPQMAADIKLDMPDLSPIEQRVNKLLAAGSRDKNDDKSPKRVCATLCLTIDSSMTLVLPKTHTPQAGATIRSMTHHLALIRDTPVEVAWGVNEDADPKVFNPLSDTLNVLLVPWPLEIPLTSFEPSKDLSRKRRELASDHRYFDYEPPKMSDFVVLKVEELIKAAEEKVGPIHAIVFPELSLTRETFDKLAQRPGIRELSIFIAGVAHRDATSEHAQNYAMMRLFRRLQAPDKTTRATKTDYQQHKHHRWYLERYQIENYGLAGKLDPEKQWWESTSFRQRRVNFVALHYWLTMSLLICEDLARPDPVAEVVRAVGPNLIIALLLDGPQLPERWASRWASTLVDDPGSSVLILTSLGMTLRDRRSAKKPESRQVGLWKDKSGFKPLILDEGAAGIAITLASEKSTEYTLDGRGDNDAACSIRLAAVQSIAFDLGE